MGGHKKLRKNVIRPKAGASNKTSEVWMEKLEIDADADADLGRSYVVVCCSCFTDEISWQGLAVLINQAPTHRSVSFWHSRAYGIVTSSRLSFSLHFSLLKLSWFKGYGRKQRFHRICICMGVHCSWFSE